MGADINRFNSYKILAYSDRLRAIANGEHPYPIDWHIFPSNICNHKCTWCMYRQNGEQFNFAVKLPRDVLLKGVRDAARTGAVLVHFSGGGEPLLNRHTPEAMELAQSLGLKVALSTNGSLLKPEVVKLVDYVRVSLNAGTADQHWRTNHGSDERDPGDWHRILDNIRKCVPHKRLDFGLGFVVDYENWQDIEPFCEIAADTGVDFVHIRPGFYYEAEKDALTRACMPDALEVCNRAKETYGDKVKIFAITEKFDGYWTPRSYHQCFAIWTGTTLRATGDFAVCQDRTDLVFGTNPSYRNGATFEEVWHSQEHIDLVSRIHDDTGGELSACPRCVWNNRNNIIHDAFIKDDMRLALV